MQPLPQSLERKSAWAISCLAKARGWHVSTSLQCSCRHVAPKAVPHFSPASWRLTAAQRARADRLAAILSLTAFQPLLCVSGRSQPASQMAARFSVRGRRAGGPPSLSVSTHLVEGTTSPSSSSPPHSWLLVVAFATLHSISRFTLSYGHGLSPLGPDDCEWG